MQLVRREGRKGMGQMLTWGKFGGGKEKAGGLLPPQEKKKRGGDGFLH